MGVLGSLKKGCCFVVGFECSFTFAPYRGAGDLLSLLRQSVNLHSSSARQLLRPKSMATALQMLARYPTLLCFAPCIHAFMPQNLFTRLMNTGSKQKKGDPDVQVCFADFPHFASFFRRVRTSRALRVVGQAHAFSRKKDAPFGWT